MSHWADGPREHAQRGSRSSSLRGGYDPRDKCAKIGECALRTLSLGPYLEPPVGHRTCEG
eukprot:6213337-Pyramimonas_sp.AAC.1